MIQTCLKEQGSNQTCTIKPCASYKHDQIIFQTASALTLTFDRKNNVGNHFIVFNLVEKLILHLFLRIFGKKLYYKNSSVW